MATIFFTFDENYKTIDPRNSINCNRKKIKKTQK